MLGRSLARSFLDFCLPRQCPACQLGYEGSTHFCAACEDELLLLESAPRCRLCAMPAARAGSPCAQCLGRGLPPFENVVSLGVLKDPLKAAIHQVKYQRRWALAEQLVHRLLKRNDVLSTLRSAHVVMPVPLHRTRQRERGYNQAEVIARRLIRRSVNCNNLRFAEPVVRVLPTDTQTHLITKTSRAENLRNAFVLIDAKAIAEKNIVLIDDVMTTGATLVSLARTLSPGKPSRLSAIVLAVADPKGRQFEEI